MKIVPRWPPKTTQNRPKRLPRTSFFRPRFRIDFCRILAPKMPPFGHPFRCQNRSMDPRAPQDAPKRLPRRPREAPRAPKTLPRCPPERILAPLGAQVGPSSVQNGSRKAIFSKNVNFQKSEPRVDHSTIWRSRSVPRRPQVGPRSSQEGYKRQLFRS